MRRLGTLENIYGDADILQNQFLVKAFKKIRGGTFSSVDYVITPVLY